MGSNLPTSSIVTGFKSVMCTCNPAPFIVEFTFNFTSCDQLFQKIVLSQLQLTTLSQSCTILLHIAWDENF